MTMTAPSNITADWFDLLYGDVPDDEWLTLFAVDRSTGDRSVRWAPVADRHKLAAAARAMAGSCVWFGVATRADRLANGARGGADDCVTVPGMWVDIDIDDDAHKGTRTYAPDLESALDLLADYPLPPTAVIHSGHGVQAWWLFNEPQRTDDVADLLDQWAVTWEELGNRRGWHVDNVFDTARVMRLPGTLNNKLDPVPVDMLELHPDRRWGVDDLAQYLLEQPERPPTPTLRPAVPYIGPERPGDAFNAQNTCGDVLEAAGWTFHHEDGTGRHYTRPGKNTRDGASATVYRDDGHCIVWTDATSLEVRRSYDPAGLFAHLFHGGDWRAAASALRSQGYGAQPVDLKAFIAAQYGQPAADDPWPAPQPLDHIATPPAFPVHVLPDWIADRVHSVAASVSTPLDLPAVLALGALSTACLGKVEIQLKADYVEEANLYIAVALPPSAGKSPVFKRMMAPIYAAERDMRTAMEAEIVRATARRDALEKQRRNAENKGSVDDAVALAMQVMEATAAIPKMPQLVSDDATPEAFAELLGANGGRMAIMSTEGGPFEMMAGRYSEGNKSRLEVYLGAWSGDSVRVNRIRRDEPLIIPKALATLVLTVQPTVLENLAEDMRGKGLTARIMYSLPAPQRRIVDSPAEPEAVRTAYDERLRDLIDRMRQFSAPGRINCTDEASRAWIDWAQDLYDRAHGGDLQPVAEWVGKVTASVGRTAALLHIADGHEFAPLAAVTMHRAIAIGDYWVAHAMAVHQLWDLDGSGRRAGLILEHVRRTGELDVKPRDVMAGARRQIPDRTAFDAAMRVLEESGWARLASGRRDAHGRSSEAPIYRIHPLAVGENVHCAASSTPKTPEKGAFVHSARSVPKTCVEPSSSSSSEEAPRSDTAPPAQSAQSAQSPPAEDLGYDPRKLL